MRVLVTGGTGYVGSHIVRQLSINGYEVVVACRSLQKTQPMETWPGVEVQLANHEHLLLKGIDAVVHAAMIWPDESLDGELLDLHCCYSVFDQACRANVRQIVYISSTAVHRPFTAFPSVGDRLHTSEVYGATKASAELFLSALTSSTQTSYQILRLGPVIGEPLWKGGPFKMDRRFATILDAANLGRTISIAQNDARQFVSAVDAAKLVVGCLSKNPNRRTYLCCDKEHIPWRDFAVMIIQKMGSSSRYEEASQDTVPSFDVTDIERDFGLVLDAKPYMAAHVDALLEAYTQCH